MTVTRYGSLVSHAICRYTGVIILRNGTECYVALLSGTEQLFNICLHEISSCLGL